MSDRTVFLGKTGSLFIPDTDAFSLAIFERGLQKDLTYWVCVDHPTGSTPIDIAGPYDTRDFCQKVLGELTRAAVRELIASVEYAEKQAASKDTAPF